MLHFTCDHCGKALASGEDQRYVVKIEAFSAEEMADVTEADLEEDHMQAVSELLRNLEETDSAVEEPNKHFRYDLCQGCHQRFVRDPLGKENNQKLFFSKN